MLRGGRLRSRSGGHRLRRERAAIRRRDRFCERVARSSVGRVVRLREIEEAGIKTVEAGSKLLATGCSEPPCNFLGHAPAIFARGVDFFADFDGVLERSGLREFMAMVRPGRKRSCTILGRCNEALRGRARVEGF